MQLPEAETAFNWKIVQSRSFSPLSLTQLSPSLSREPVWKATSPYSIDINSTRIELYFCLLENIEPKTIAVDNPLTSRLEAHLEIIYLIRHYALRTAISRNLQNPLYLESKHETNASETHYGISISTSVWFISATSLDCGQLVLVLLLG